MAGAFRFALDVGENTSRDVLVDLIHRGEAAGFSVVTGPDHIGSRLAAVLPMLAVASGISPTIRISPMVLANDFRHPVILAKDTATLDILSEGRFELAIGTGWIKHQYVAAGIPYDSAGTRVDRFEEAIQVIKGCWSGEPFTFDGGHYQVKDVTCPRPVQQPHPPILVAGAGPRMLNIAGREADIVGLAPLTPGSSTFERFGSDIASSGDRIAAQIEWIRQGAGPRFDEIEINVFAHHVTVTDTPSEAAEELAGETSSTLAEIEQSPHVLIGTTESITETLQHRREAFGISYIAFDAEDLDDVAPIVSQLAGK